VKVAPVERNARTGFLLTLASDFVWGIQPVAMAILVLPFEPATVAFFKVFSAMIGLGLFLITTGKLKVSMSRAVLGVLIIAAVSLTFSYLFYAFEFKFISPSETQLYLQLSRIFLILFGVFAFREGFSRGQWIGLCGICAGFVLVYGQQSMNTGYNTGIILAVGTSLTWAFFAAAQKFLLRHLSSTNILFVSYLIASVILFPFSTLSPSREIGATEFLCLTIVCSSNLFAYALFSQALKHWEVSRVSAISCMTSFVTVLLMQMFSTLMPDKIQPESLGVSFLIGMVLVVGGAMGISLLQKKYEA
jgi:drug/metabolite transporter (DMT)-like permease